MTTHTSHHPLQDIRIEGCTFDRTHRAHVVTYPQPGRVLFKDAEVLIRNCTFDGRGATEPLLRIERK